MDTDTAWRLWGEREPYYAVLTNAQFRSSALTEQAKAEFFLSGDMHVASVLEHCRLHFDSTFRPRRVLDFGCGVGRTTIPFAATADEVVGLDIAPAMLSEAARNCAARGLQNVQLHLSDDTLSRAAGEFDLVHSSIVLQHVDVVRGRRLFQELVAKISHGGLGAIHLTFAWDFHAATFGRPTLTAAAPVPAPVATALASRVSTFRAMVRKFRDLAAPPRPAAADPPLAPSAADETTADPEMQMHYYELSDVMFILQRAGVETVFSKLTDHGGAIGTFLYFQKP